MIRLDWDAELPDRVTICVEQSDGTYTPLITVDVAELDRKLAMVRAERDGTLSRARRGS